jgi:hypothetical protein
MTIKHKPQYILDQYQGIPIKCNAQYPTFENIVQALYILVYGASRAFRYARGYHVRTRFTDKMTCSEYSAHLNNYYKIKFKYIPLRVTVSETDESGIHHHHAIILNDKLSRKSSLQHLHAKLKKEGKLADYSIIAPDHDKYGHHLQTIEDLDSYFKWMTYLAKIKSKPIKHQLWSGSRQVTSMLKEWRDNKMPDVRGARIKEIEFKASGRDLSNYIS